MKTNVDERLNHVALTLLSEHHCKLSCYRNDKKDYAFKDLVGLFGEDHKIMGYTMREIADELQRIGDDQPALKKIG